MSTRRVICTLFLLLFPATAHGGERAMAWDRLKERDPAIASRLSPREKAAFQALTQEQLEAYITGKPATEIYLTNGETLADILKATSEYEIKWFAFSSGARPTANADFRIEATIGQPFSSTAGNDDYTLTTGFWVVAKEFIHDDDFESGDLSGWSDCIGVGCPSESEN